MDDETLDEVLWDWISSMHPDELYELSETSGDVHCWPNTPAHVVRDRCVDECWEFLRAYFESDPLLMHQSMIDVP